MEHLGANHVHYHRLRLEGVAGSLHAMNDGFQYGYGQKWAYSLASVGVSHPCMLLISSGEVEVPELSVEHPNQRLVTLKTSQVLGNLLALKQHTLHTAHDEGPVFFSQRASILISRTILLLLGPIKQVRPRSKF